MRGRLIVLIAVLVFLGFFTLYKITGYLIGEHTIGPSVEEMACMKQCAFVGCESGDEACMRENGDKCMQQCNVQEPESTSDTACMEKCVVEGCGEFDFDCQGKNKDRCEEECNMIQEPEAKSEEEQCIRDCVNLHEPGTICSASAEGETGNSICQMCAKQCENLYAGPCLDEEKLEAKKKECQTCEHCYGEPVMGDSGEGWDCIVDVKCKDASSEFRDNPGTGPGIGQEGFIEKVEGAVGNVFENIGNFFKNLFS